MTLNEIEVIANQMSGNTHVLVTHKRDDWYLFTFKSFSTSIGFMTLLQGKGINSYSSSEWWRNEGSTGFSISVQVD